jgi:hypothetical protein
MKIEYDPKADAMYIRLAAGPVADSDEVRPGVVLDFDAEGRVLRERGQVLPVAPSCPNQQSGLRAALSHGARSDPSVARSPRVRAETNQLVFSRSERACSSSSLGSQPRSAGASAGERRKHRDGGCSGVQRAWLRDVDQINPRPRSH